MPELPDVSLYVKRLQERVVGYELMECKFYSPFLLRSTGTALSELVGKTTRAVSRLGKRIVFEFDDELFMIVHLMIAGRFAWTDETGPRSTRPSKVEMGSWRWSSGRLTMTEASSKKRAGVWIERGREKAFSHRRGGMDVATATRDEFGTALKSSNRTLKRALTDPSSFDGIGNAFSDEILHAAKLSPIRLTSTLSEDEVARLLLASQETLGRWTALLEKKYPGFPKSSQITAFRPEFAVHGKYGEPCPVCGAPVQRIVAAEHEVNYCAQCQNEGKILADRSLSRLLKDAWPKTIEDLMGDR